MSTSRLKIPIITLVLLAVLFPNAIFHPVRVEAQSASEFPRIQLNQTVDMRVVFLGVSSDLIDEGMFLSSVTKSISQFAQPNNMTWSLNTSISFHEFPVEVITSLINGAYIFEGATYYNVTLLDRLLSQVEYLAVPQKGYLLVFMGIPNGGVSHSWFYAYERPDLLLGRTDFFDSSPSEYWAFPPYFGGIRRALYFDLSDLIEKNPMKALVTNTSSRLFNNALSDVFVNLLGVTDSRMIEADMQRYENYEVKILWLNGTDGQIQPQQIERTFEDLMPWTNWTTTVQTKPMDVGLNSLIANRTVELAKPLTYSFSLSNSSRFTIQAKRNVQWDVLKDSGEYDPITQYLFDNVKDYFNLTDLEDKSIVPVVFLQTRNDTAIGGFAGIGPGISWFPNNVIIMGYQGGTVTAMGESGPILLTQQLRHEIGHWVSLSHHSARFDLGYPKVVCSMRALTNQFCAFCKDARARMSFISYYRATAEMISNDTQKVELLRNEIEDALQLFYDWKYVEAVEAIIAVHNNAQASTSQTVDFTWIGFAIVGVAVVIGLVLILRKKIGLGRISS